MLCYTKTLHWRQNTLGLNSSNIITFLKDSLFEFYDFLNLRHSNRMYLLILIEYNLHRYVVTNFIQLISPQLVDWFYKLSCTGKPWMRAICIYVRYTKVTMNNWDIRPLATVKALFANISWIARQIDTIKLALESTHQIVSNDI